MSAHAVQAGLVGGAVFALVAAGEGLGAGAIARLAISGATLAAAAVFDLRERRIPNRLTLPAAASLLVVWALGGAAAAPIAAGLAVTALLLVLGLLRPDAIGMGDAKLAFVIALGLTDKALLGLASGLLLAALFAAARLAAGSTQRGTGVPLGPFLALGALLALIA